MAKPARDEETGTGSIVRVRLNSGGYDRFGTYWGSGYGCMPLYAIETDNYTTHVRAHNRRYARLYALDMFPNCTFRRHGRDGEV